MLKSASGRGSVQVLEPLCIKLMKVNLLNSNIISLSLVVKISAFGTKLFETQENYCILRKMYKKLIH